MNDMELADRIEQIGLVRFCHETGMVFMEEQRQIIAALRRGPEAMNKNETVAEKVKRLQDKRAQIDMELSELL